MTDVQYENCAKVDDNKIICAQETPIWLPHIHRGCEILLYLGATKIPPSCDTSVSELLHPAFLQLKKSNTWLFAIPLVEILTITCSYLTKPIDVRINETGSITLSPKCKAYGSSVILTPKFVVTIKEVNSDFVPEFNIVDECCETIKNKSLNITNLRLSANYKTIDRHLDDLNLASHKLENIGKAADELAKSNSSVCRIHHTR